MPASASRKKGFFGRVGLPASSSYVFPKGRSGVLLAGGAGGLLAAVGLLLNIWFQAGSFVSNGPLSSSHASFEGECESCHSRFEAVSDEKCSTCHEKYGDELGAHSLDAHYVYRSGDFRRAYRREGELDCIGCHREHLGREAFIASVPDARCIGCHPFGSFDTAHPQFDFIVEATPDHDSLAFAHIRHVKRVQERDKSDDLERVCFSCHTPTLDGRGFEAISFEQHCGDCHLTSSPRTRSANLTIRDSRLPLLSGGGQSSRLNLGVETLEVIRDRQGPGDHWALFANPAEFRQRGNRVMKTRLRHEDPWILHNLRMFRRLLYPSAGLSHLLRASADVEPHQTRILYNEAVQTLQEYSEGLRSRSDASMQKELEEIDQLLRSLDQKLRSEIRAPDDSVFLLTGPPNPRLSASQLQEVEIMVQELTEACRVCHRIEMATVSRVRNNQRVLRRADFNHQAHVIQRRCLDCHSRIPFEDYPGDPPPADAEFDQARVQNLPGIEVCRDCHSSGLSANHCTSCHRFHPERDQELRLLPYAVSSAQ